MDLETRIRRRRRTARESQLVLDYDAISPVAHLDEPVDRGPLLERLLDHVEPTFEGKLPGDAYVYGPSGAGKSAVVASLFAALDAGASGSRAIGTTTRVASQPETSFVYVDTRQARSEFALYRSVLDGLVDEQVPQQGVGTSELRDRLDRQLSRDRQALVAVDHVGEPRTPTLSSVVDTFARPDVSVLVVTRDDPGSGAPPTTMEVPAYQEHALVDVVTERAAGGLAQHAVEHTRLREIADWADGDAHDALAALFGAVDAALEDGREHVAPADVEDGKADVPPNGAPLGRVLSLSTNRQVVLRALLDLDEPVRSSVASAADAVAESVDLSTGTVERLLYELADDGIVDRVETERAASGRPPSRVVPQFATRTFRRLYDLTN